MADNDWSPAASGAGPPIATDDIGGFRYQRIKLIHGADGVNDGDISTTNPLPINYTKSATVIDTSTAALGIGASYTSPTFDHSLNGSFVTHYIFSDVGGTHYFEVSHDGSTGWQIADQEVVIANVPLFESHQVNAKFSRARYVNGGTAQTTFYHQAIQKFIGQDEYIKINPDQNAITGSHSTNIASPTSDNIGVLPAIANAAAPSYTEGRQVLLRTTLAGDVAITLDGEVVDITPASPVATDYLPVRQSDGTNFIGVAANPIRIDPTGTTIQPVSGTVTAAQATAASLNAQVVGELAHDAVDSGNPQKIGGIARNTNVNVSATGDRVNATFDLGGRQITKLGNPRTLVTQNTVTLTTTTETTILAAMASTFHDLTMLEITNSSATAVVVSIRDATAGTVRKNYAIAANGGAIIPMPHPWEQTTANNNWTATLSAAVTSVYINVSANMHL